MLLMDGRIALRYARRSGHDEVLMYDANNIFAKILRGELPKIAVYEDEHTLAFMDIMPAVEGHTLVIPKELCESIFDISPEAAAATIQTTQKVATAVKKALDVPGVVIVQQNGSAAGQTIFHLHIHIIPRTSGIDLTFHGKAMVKPDVLEPIAAKIRAAL
jgi:histidine triad (HIT) family protein